MMKQAKGRKGIALEKTAVPNRERAEKGEEGKAEEGRVKRAGQGQAKRAEEDRAEEG